MKKLAIIGSGRMAWIYGLHARKMGIESHSFSNDPNCLAKESVDFHHLVSIFEMDEIVKICKQISISGVVATTELTVPVASYVSEKLGLVGIPYANAKYIVDKYRNRKLCEHLLDLHQPKFEEIYHLSSLDAPKWHYPIILKPTARGGKQGIVVVKQKEELQDAFGYAKSFSKDAPIIVEDFIEDGQEYSVESLSYRGKHHIIQITEKITSGPPHCVELGHHQPADISECLWNKVVSAVSQGLDAIGLDNSSCHTEIKIVDDEIYLIEFNARPGGDHIAWPLTELSTGYSYIKGAIEIAIGEFNEDSLHHFQRNYAGVYFVSSQTAYLKGLFDICESFPWCYKKNLVSEDVKPITHNDCYGINSIMYFSKEGRVDAVKITKEHRL